MVEVSFIGNFEIMDYKENTKCLQFALEKLLKSFKAEDRPKLMDQKQAIFCHVPKGAGPTTCYVYMYIFFFFKVKALRKKNIYVHIYIYIFFSQCLYFKLFPVSSLFVPCKKN